jgi:hypothetical protein
MCGCWGAKGSIAGEGGYVTSSFKSNEAVRCRRSVRIVRRINAQSALMS